MFNRILPAIALTTALAATPAAAYVNVWSTGFETSEYETIGPFPFSSLTTFYGGSFFGSAGTAPGLGSQLFRNETAGITTFSVAGLGSHTSLKLSFDVVFIDSWDSNNGSVSPDWLTINVDGVSNDYTVASASGSNYILGPGTLLSVGQYMGSGWNDHIVRYEYILPHTASSFFLSLNAGGAGFQYGSDESWGIDNFSLSALPTVGGVPEPTSWAMLIAGFGLTGAMMRRRRAVVA